MIEKSNEKNVLHVVAAALVSENGRVLVQQRPTGSSMEGLWEFPGGKVEPGETPEAALARELFEELGISVDQADLLPLSFASEPLGESHLVLLLFLCTKWSGEAMALHATNLKWVEMDALDDLAMPPADRPLVFALRRLLQPSQAGARAERKIGQKNSDTR